MLLTFATGESFANGAIDYFYRPAVGDITPRIILQVAIQGVLVDAILDTGAPYVVCTPHIAQVIGLRPDPHAERITLGIRGSRQHGYLHRLSLTFVATQGESLDIDATIFVPDAEWEASWGDHPSYIGLTGCLERMRYAVDPDNDIFYFGPLS